MSTTPVPVRPLVRRSRGERRVTYALKIVALIVLCMLVLAAVVTFLGRIPSVTVILVGSIFFTYVIYPVVRFVHERGASLVAAIALTYVVILTLLVLLIAFVLPQLVDDMASVVAATPHAVATAQLYVQNPHHPLIAHLPPIVRTQLARLPTQLATFGQQYAGLALGQVMTVVASLVGIVATIVVIPVIAVYLMFEAPDLIAGVLRAVPEKARPRTLAVVRDIDSVLGGFIRGQLLVGATIGTCITIALLILRVKYALLIGVLAGLFDVIPYVGAFVGFVPSVSLALFNSGWQHALIVALVFVGIFQAEGHFIAPRIVSDSVGLTPLMVIVAILIGGELGGISGMFLAVPAAGLIRVVIMQSLPRVSLEPEPPPVPSIDETAEAAGLSAGDRTESKKAATVKT